MTFDLNLLRVLDALLETGSTTLAGKRVGLSQPAVSAALGRLRHALGDPIFVRKGRMLVPTDYAQGLRAPLREILEQTESLLSGPGEFDPARSDARFKISGSDFYAEMLLPALAHHLSRNAPGMRVQLVDLVPDNYVHSLDQFGVDMAILPQTEFPDWVESRFLHRSHFTIIARRGHPRLQEAGVTPGDAIPLDLFCELQHVLFSPEGNLSGMADAALEALGRKRNVAMTMPVFSGVYNAVAQSNLIALVPHQLAERVAPRVGLDIFRPPIRIEPAELVLIWHKRSTRTPAHSWLRDQIAMLMEPLDSAPFPGPIDATEQGHDSGGTT